MTDFIATEEDLAKLRKVLWEVLLFEYPTIRDYSERQNYHANGWGLRSYSDAIVDKNYSFTSARSSSLSQAGFLARSRLEAAWRDVEKGYKESFYPHVEEISHEFLTRLERISKSDSSEDWSALTGNYWMPLAPLPRLLGQEISPSNAEYLCKNFMLFMGAEGAEVTRGSKDGGLDIVSDDFVAQVKHLHTKTGVKALRELLGASVSTKKIPVFFSKNGFTAEARDFAIENHMLIYSYPNRFTPCSMYTVVYDKYGMDVTVDSEPWMHTPPHRSGLSGKQPFLDHAKKHYLYWGYH